MNDNLSVEILRFESLPSTQDYIKGKRELGKDLCVIAKTQTGGKGTKGRTFSSSAGGVYLSLLRFYENMPASDAFLVMARAAVAVCKTLETYGVEPKIKWANDVFVQGKKICGILIENVCSGNSLKSSVIGVGVNVNNELPEELKPIATTLFENVLKKTDLKEFEQTLLRFLYAPFAFEEYEKRLGFLGKEVTLALENGEEKFTLKGVDKRGNLLVEKKGETQKFAVGEVRVCGGIYE